jgi:hypothetical protein
MDAVLESLLMQIHLALGWPERAEIAGLLHPFYSANTGKIKFKKPDGTIFTPNSAMSVQIGLILTSSRPLEDTAYGTYTPTTGVGHRVTVIVLIHDKNVLLDYNEVIRYTSRAHSVRFLGLDNDPIRTMSQAGVDFEELSVYPVDLRGLMLEVEVANHLSY